MEGKCREQHYKETFWKFQGKNWNWKRKCFKGLWMLMLLSVMGLGDFNWCLFSPDRQIWKIFLYYLKSVTSRLRHSEVLVSWKWMKWRNRNINLLKVNNCETMLGHSVVHLFSLFLFPLIENWSLIPWKQSME